MRAVADFAVMSKVTCVREIYKQNISKQIRNQNPLFTSSVETMIGVRFVFLINQSRSSANVPYYPASIDKIFWSTVYHTLSIGETKGETYCIVAR